jgi:hypothetical protein
MVERVEMCRGTVVVDGKVYSVKRHAEPFFLLRLNGLSPKYFVVTADSIDFHGFERLVWPLAGEQVSIFETLDAALAYYLNLTGSSRA